MEEDFKDVDGQIAPGNKQQKSVIGMSVLHCLQQWATGCPDDANSSKIRAHFFLLIKCFD